MKNFTLTIFLITSQLFFSQEKIELNISQDDREYLQEELDVNTSHANLTLTKFVLNPYIRNRELNIGDKIVFNFDEFQNQEAVVTYKRLDINGVTSYTCKFDNYNFAQAFISINESEYLVSINIPEQNRKILSIINNDRSSYYLAELDTSNLDYIECKDNLINKVNTKYTPLELPELDKHDNKKRENHEDGENGFSEKHFGATKNNNNKSSSSACSSLGENDVADARVLIVYTQNGLNFAGSQAAMDLIISQQIAKANNASSNSTLGINFILAHSEFTTYLESGNSGDDLSRLRGKTDGFMDNIHALRDTHSADFVHLFSNTNDTGGLGYILQQTSGREDLGFALSRIQQLSFTETFIHELGHNMSASHAKGQNVQAGPTTWIDWPTNTWTAGWRFQGSDSNYYATIMTYTSGSSWPDGISSTEISYFSTPLLSFSGTPIGDAVDGDNLRSLKSVKHVVSKYRDEVTSLFCAASADNPSTLDLSINNIKLNTIDHSSSWSGFNDFSFIKTCLDKGTSYPLEINFENGFSDMAIRVWVDWNNDNDFDDTDEQVAFQTTGTSTQFNTNLIPPNTAFEGEVRMRIRYEWTGSGNVDSPCGINTFGEVEDYTLVIRGDNNWEGTVNTDWNTPGNWSLGVVPTNTDTAVIPDVPNQPLIDASTTADVDNLVLNGNTVLSVEGILKVSGDISNDGEIIFKSPPMAKAGQFDEFTGTISGSGEVTVERFIPEKRAFRLLSSPVTTTDFIYENWQENGSTPTLPDGLGTHITGGAASLGFDQSGSNNPSMFTFDAAIQNWEPLENTNAIKLRPGEAYLTMVRGDRSIDVTSNEADPEVTTLRSTGAIHTGTLTYSVGNPTSYLNINDVDEFYNLIANPYQAVVDFDVVNKTGLTGYIYVWDAVIDGANGRGGYVTVDLPSAGVVPPPASSSQASHYLAPGMSFFVQNDSDAGTTSSITFQETDKRTDVTEVDIFSTYSNFYINSRLYSTSAYLNGETESDAIGLRFSDNFTTPGTSEDATKLFNPGENYAIENNGLRSIDKQQIPTIGHQIDLNILNYQETNYSLTFEMDNKPAGLGVFLEDSYLNTITELSDSFVYDYTVDTNIPESTATNRFSLIFNNTTLGIEDTTFGSDFTIYPNPTQDGRFAIKTPNLFGEVEIKISNALGQQVFNENLNVEANEVNVNAKKLSSGVYIIELSQGEQSFTSKLIME